MTYHELIDLYKRGKLNEEQKETVEKDIERQEAISEYLFDEGEIFGLEDLGKEEGESGKTVLFEDFSGEDMDDEEIRFTKIIRASIRRAFIKMGITVSAVVLGIILLIIFVLPKVVDSFYYDPGEIVGSSEQYAESETNRISLDFAVYSELFLPETYRQYVFVEDNGYGEYDINIKQETSYTKMFTDVAGKIERNKITLYDSNLLSRPASNAFMRSIPGVAGGFMGTGAAGYPEEAKQALQELDEEDCYAAYVTLSEVLSYSDFIEWCENKNPRVSPNWCAITAKTEKGYRIDVNIGFIYAGSYSSIFHEENYPYLTQWEVGQTRNEKNIRLVSEEVMTTHMVSMLRYMEEQKAFNKMMKCERDYGFLAKNVEENGLHIYGFMMIGNKDQIIEMSNKDKVAYIYTKPLR